MTKILSADEQETAKASAKKEETYENFFKEIIKTVVYAVLIATVFRTVLYEPFNIPSESMLPTLMTGDYLLVSKMSYGYSHYSIPFSPNLFSGRILADDVERGDIAVFKTPRDNDTDFIKRIVGLPGDRMQMLGGQLFINGEAVKKVRVEDFVFTESENMHCGDHFNYRFPQADGTVECRYPQYRETLPNGRSHMTIDLKPNGRSDNIDMAFVVPAGHYFAMGDNRDNSQDSRVPVTIGGVGYVPAENLVGRAEVIFYSTNGNARLWEVWKWYGAARGNRFFMLLSPDEQASE